MNRLRLPGTPLPGFLTGIARALDLGGVFDDPHALTDLPDELALASDWEAVLGDIEQAKRATTR